VAARGGGGDGGGCDCRGGCSGSDLDCSGSEGRDNDWVMMATVFWATEALKHLDLKEKGQLARGGAAAGVEAVTAGQGGEGPGASLKNSLVS
jgi:hypothetical protein